MTRRDISPSSMHTWGPKSKASSSCTRCEEQEQEEGGQEAQVPREEASSLAPPGTPPWQLSAQHKDKAPGFDCRRVRQALVHASRAGVLASLSPRTSSLGCVPRAWVGIRY